jgi:hypothetical protein
MPASDIRITDHARQQALLRGLDIATVLLVAQRPEQVLPLTPGRKVRQSRVLLPGARRVYLVRVVVDTTQFPEAVITTYRTSRLAKYWRQP